MTTVNDDLIRAFLADEAPRAVAAAPSLDQAVGRLAPRIGGRPSGASRRLFVLLAATLLLVAALGTAIAVGSGLLRLPLVIDFPTVDQEVPTTEDGDPLAKPFEFLEGEVTFATAPPWDYSPLENSATMDILVPDDRDEERVMVMADPRPIERRCFWGPAQADAEALARRLRSDPDLEATEPLAVSVAGREALRMDVVTAPGASVCGGTTRVVSAREGVALSQGSRMRLYMFDLPDGSSARILAIAIVAPEADFERVLAAAAPIVASFEFHAP